MGNANVWKSNSRPSNGINLNYFNFNFVSSNHIPIFKTKNIKKSQNGSELIILYFHYKEKY